MSDPYAKAKIKEAIVKAIKKLVKNKKPITMQKISKMIGGNYSTSTVKYYGFVLDYCKKNGLMHMTTGTLSSERLTNEQSKKMSSFRNISDKALGIGLDDHNTYRR